MAVSANPRWRKPMRTEQRVFRREGHGVSDPPNHSNIDGFHNLEYNHLTLGITCSFLHRARNQRSPWKRGQSTRAYGGNSIAYHPLRFLSGIRRDNIKDHRIIVSVPAQLGILGPAIFADLSIGMFPVPNLLSLDPNTVVTRLRQSIGLDSANNAAPPASTDAISRLERRKVGCDMPGPSSMEDCTVCLEKMANGEDVVLLPCEHQFHELCGVDWLKRRNRCPNCRSSIQERTHYLVGEC